MYTHSIFQVTIYIQGGIDLLSFESRNRRWFSHYHRLLSWLKCWRRGVQLWGLSLGLTVMFARAATPGAPPWSTRTPPWSTRPASRPDPPPPRTQQCEPPPDRTPDSASEIVASSPWPGLPPPPPVTKINKNYFCQLLRPQKRLVEKQKCATILFYFSFHRRHKCPFWPRLVFGSTQSMRILFCGKDKVFGQPIVNVTFDLKKYGFSCYGFLWCDIDMRTLCMPWSNVIIKCDHHGHLGQSHRAPGPFLFLGIHPETFNPLISWTFRVRHLFSIVQVDFISHSTNLSPWRER